MTSTNPAAPDDLVEQPRGAALWAGDEGSLPEQSRRALLALIRGPYLSQASAAHLWRALLADEAAVRSRLNDLFLELHLHLEAGVAFVRNVRSDELAVPSAVRSRPLTFMDTLMLLVLRQMLLSQPTGERVIVGKDEVFEQLVPFRTPDRDEADFRKRMDASWKNMRGELRVLQAASRGDADERMEISPVLGLLVDAERAQALTAEYRRLAAAGEDDGDDA